MIKQIKISLLVVVFAFFASCDYIITPLKPRIVVNSNDSNKVYKNIMVEDYTGSTCVNCPPAGAELDSLISIYGSRIIPLSVNAGNFATPVNTYSLNLQSAVGDVYDGQTAFNMSATGNPCGMVNRINDTIGASKYLLYTKWATKVQKIITNDTAFIKLTLTTTFDTSTRALSVTATSTFLKSLSGAYNIVILLTQDNIIGPQKTQIAPGEIPNYAHRFVLRDAINGTWGDALVTAGSALNQVVTKTYNYSLATSYPAQGTTNNPANKPAVPCNFKNCSIVAYIYCATAGTNQGNSQYDVMQSQQKKIYP